MTEQRAATSREEGLDEELGFWYRWLRDRGDPWSWDYDRRTNPRAPLQTVYRELLRARPGARVRILDVGSGPLTTLGTRWPGRKVSITAVDPLADRYNELLDEAGITPPVRPIKGDAERLTELLPHGSFDLACATNSLDHAHDPVRAIRQMLQLVKPGRHVLLDHRTDEGELMGYTALHQWNFRAEDGSFVVWRPGLRVDISALLEPHAEINVRAHPDEGWLRVVLRRHSAPPSSPSRSTAESSREIQSRP
jgi:SAM-dependent methyltransferase